MKKFDRFINDYNDGKASKIIVPFFGGNIQTFYAYIDFKNSFDDLEFDTDDTEDFDNEYLFYLSKNYSQRFLDFAITKFDDVEKKEDGHFYLSADSSDISRLFCNSHRDTLSPKTVERILDGETEFFYDVTTDDVYNSVIEDLTPQNKQIMFDRFLEQKIQITPDTDFLEEIANTQNDSGMIEPSNEILSKIFTDKESTISVLKQLNGDVVETLKNIYSYAYESAYYDELYDNIMSQVEDLLGGTPKRDSNDNYQVKLDESTFLSVLQDFVNSNRNYPSTNFDYFGDYIDLLRDEKDCLDVYVPDYPDWNNIKKNINSYFLDYF